MKSSIRNFCCLALVWLLTGACVSTPDSEEITEENKTDRSETERIEDLAVQTFDDADAGFPLEGISWIWPEDDREITDMVRSNRSEVTISTKTDSPDGSPYLVWETTLDFDIERFPMGEAGIGRGIRFLYSPLFTYLRQFEPDGIYLEARSSVDMPIRVQLNAKNMSAGTRVLIDDTWRKIYVPFSAFGVHVYDREGEIALTPDLLRRFYEISLEQGIYELDDGGLLREKSGPLSIAMAINTIGLYKVEGALPEHIVEHFDSPIPHIQLQGAGVEIFSDREEERRRTDILVDPVLSAERVTDGGGAGGTSGYFGLSTSFEVSDNVKELGPQTGIGVVTRFRGAVDMSRYLALRFAVRSHGLRYMWLSIYSDQLNSGIHHGFEIPREDEWFEVEVPFYEFGYDERAPLNEDILTAFLETVNRFDFGFNVQDTTHWNGEYEDKAAFVGAYEVELALDNIELVGEMPAFAEFMRLMEESRK